MRRATYFTDCVIHTGRTETETARSMLVRDGRIVSLNEKPPKGCNVVSLNHRHVYPCLIDGHVHLLATIVLAAQGFDVCKIERDGIVPTNMKGVETRLRAFANGKSKRATLVGNGYIASAIAERRMPNRHELDDWCGGRPVAIYSIDGHASALSTAMLRKLSIDPNGHDGILTGEAHDRIQGRLTDVIAASVTLPVLAKGIANFQNECAAFGISCVGALEGNGDSAKDLTTKLIAHLSRHFDVDVRFYFQYFDLAKVKPLSKLQRRKRIGGCGDWEMDGALGAHSAAFSLPYRDTGTTAPCYYAQEDVDRAVMDADKAGYQIASHAIGDKAVDLLLHALEKTKSGTMHRVEHCEFASDEAIDRIASRGYAVMAQPGYSWIDKRFLHTYERYLPEEMLRRLKFKAYVDKGICICASSDSPVQSINPWQQILGMTQFYNEEESVTPYDALRCCTVNPARALLEEDERGMLLPNLRADFFTSDCSLYDLSPEELCAFRPAQTFYAGIPAKTRKGTVSELIRLLLTRPRQV